MKISRIAFNTLPEIDADSWKVDSPPGGLLSPKERGVREKKQPLCYNEQMEAGLCSWQGSYAG